MDEYMASIKMFAGTFAPRGWMYCEGQLLPIAQYTALFSLLGTTYGGDGRTTFALPDLRGRVPVGPGHGPGLSDHRLGQKGGAETNTLTLANLPSHSHSLAPVSIKASPAQATEQIPGTNGAATIAAPVAAGRPAQGFNNEAPSVSLNAGSQSVSETGRTGSNLPVNNVQPYSCISFIICVQGIFPPRD
ncbi:tail Collar domain-containing protein [Echinicola rosea]|uniref:Tail Collar domain-containing protein n=2 Tax=Echinicola rosea TaxID=1807691 RepID=A0ABQ1V5L5_9BACT|nr:tail Collar domain-containing protein [Echinicola rosea]